MERIYCKNWTKNLNKIGQIIDYYCKFYNGRKDNIESCACKCDLNKLLSCKELANKYEVKIELKRISRMYCPIELGMAEKCYMEKTCSIKEMAECWEKILGEGSK